MKEPFWSDGRTSPVLDTAGTSTREPSPRGVRSLRASGPLIARPGR